MEASFPRVQSGMLLLCMLQIRNTEHYICILKVFIMNQGLRSTVAQLTAALLLFSAIIWPIDLARLVRDLRWQGSFAKNTSTGSECGLQPYQSHIFSRDPLVIYISNFLTPQEAAELIRLRLVSSRIMFKKEPR